MEFTASDVIRIFMSNVPNKKPFAIFKASPTQMMVHASATGKPSAEPNVWMVNADRKVMIFSPIDNLQLYHKIHDPSNLVWENR